MLDAAQRLALEQILDQECLPHLPPLLDQGQTPEEQTKKDRARSRSALAIAALTGCTLEVASRAVVDDFGDLGVDIIYFHAPSDTLYLGQAKSSPSAQVSQGDMLSFTHGLRKLFRNDLDGFNENILYRRTEIEGAFESCSHIKLVVAFDGTGLTTTAQTVINEFLADRSHGEERLDNAIVYFGPQDILATLRLRSAFPRVDVMFNLRNHSKLEGEPTAYVGTMPLRDLVKLHKQHGRGLYQQNIRMYLGADTSVNTSISNSLRDNPSHFVYLSNGITALAETIEPRNNTVEGKNLNLLGLSIVNGAQTIASAAKALEAGANIDGAHVLVTVIEQPGNSDFGKQITRARNHQNSVLQSNFVALDPEQERIRRDLALLNITYSYHSEHSRPAFDPLHITVAEAAQSLALCSRDPRYVAWLKRQPGRFLDTTSEEYKGLFRQDVSVARIANAVRVNRAIQARVANLSGQDSRERATYRHGVNAIAWVVMSQLVELGGDILFVTEDLTTRLERPILDVADALWLEVQRITEFGPQALFGNQTETVRLLQGIQIRLYQLAGDLALAGIQAGTEPYPKRIFDYLAYKATRVTGLT